MQGSLVALPEPEQTIDVPTLSQYDAVALFVERARRAQPSFAISEANARRHHRDLPPPRRHPARHRAGRRPLPAALRPTHRRELDDRFRLLTGGARTVLARQQTLAASVDWSHERLDDAEQVTFRRLGVFAGPFPLEAAEAVVAAGRRRRPRRRVRPDQPSRRQEPRRRRRGPQWRAPLPAAGDAARLRPRPRTRRRRADQLRDAHAAWWADWLEPRGDMPTDDILDEIEEFHANLKAALDWSVDRPELGLRLLGACRPRLGGSGTRR